MEVIRFMQSFTIVISGDLITGDKLTYIDSVFYLQVDSKSFPCEGWTDFTYPLLNIWCEALLRMPTCDNAKCELPFMDGPFWLEVERQGEELFFTGKTSRKTPVFFSFQCKQAQFFSELLRAYRYLVKQSYENEQFPPCLRTEVKQGFQHYKTLVSRIADIQ